jgi:hypothetical protein
MRSGVKVAVIGGVFIVVAGGVGYGAYHVYDGLSGGLSTTSSAQKVETGPLTAAEIDKAAKAFLTSWGTGAGPASTAQLTTDPAAAEALIGEFHDTAHVTQVKTAPGPAVGANVPFTVNATVALDGASKPWTYSSQLTVVRGVTTGRPLVKWAPAVLYPKLTEATHLVTAEAAVPQIEAVDRNGKELTREKYPSLGPILDQLREKYGASAGGTPGIEMVMQSGDDAVAPETLLTLTKGKTGKLRTSLDAGVQAAAERAVKKFSEASVAAVKPSTGQILAIANNRKDGFNAAMQGKQAPGSTMKIVTASMLIEKGLASANQPADCPPTATWQSRTFHNDGGFSLPSGTPFSQSFARSCNTAFIKLIDDTKDDGALKKEAEEVFGLGRDNWKTGIASSDGSVPAAVGGEAAAQYIGQGTVQMNVLNMASVTATVKSGAFKQPIIVPKSLDDRQLATAERTLPNSVAQQVRDMMRLTATSGTAAEAMSVLGGDKGAKTGSAEVDNQAVSNSWFTGFDGDLAAAAVVQAGGHGGAAAGPVVAAVLAAG